MLGWKRLGICCHHKILHSLWNWKNAQNMFCILDINVTDSFELGNLHKAILLYFLVCWKQVKIKILFCVVRLLLKNMLLYEYFRFSCYGISTGCVIPCEKVQVFVTVFANTFIVLKNITLVLTPLVECLTDSASVVEVWKGTTWTRKFLLSRIWSNKN